MSGEGVRRSRARSIGVNIAIMLTTLFSGALASTYADVRIRHVAPGSPAGSASAVPFLVSWACAAALCFRHHRNLLVPTALVSCLPPLFLPVDSLPALIGLSSVLVWSTRPVERWGVGVAATAATAVAIWRDSRGTTRGSSFWGSLTNAQNAPRWETVPTWLVGVFTVLCVGTAVAIGLVRHSRRDSARHAARAFRATRTAATLKRQVVQQDEREAFAREVHDVLGHRLSILAMQANALEVEALDADPHLQERARQIQQGASGSMQDLRSLLTVLRSEPGSTDRPSDLSDLAELVRECIDAGTPVASNVFIDRSAPLDPVVSRSTYRIATELLTNARKHAPGATVVLDIRGDPATGLTISAGNPLPHPISATGTGSGLIGIAQRANDVGGTFTAGVSADGRRFVATAHLPWHRPQE